MSRIALLLTTLFLGSLAFAGTTSAHSGALVLTNPAGTQRCYLYTTDSSVELWLESNGYLGDPSVDQGVGPVNHVTGAPLGGSGLQRGSVTVHGHTYAADTKLDPTQAGSACFGLA